MEDLPDSEVLGRFISMGGNSEFGLAQRLAGAEPFDLLRWGQTEMPVVLHMLRDRFAHIGDPASMEVSVVGGEYILENHFYGFKSHTFAMEEAMSPDRILEREIMRLPRRAEILLSDMAEGHRILVRLADHGVDETGLDIFVRLCGKLGPSQIMFVSRNPQKAGTAERVGPNLLRGYVNQFAHGTDMPVTMQAKLWATLCRSALAIVEDV